MAKTENGTGRMVKNQTPALKLTPRVNHGPKG